MDRLNIFVSSTSRDLHAHLQAVRDVILSLNQKVILPDAIHFASADAVQRSYDGIQLADMFVGIYAHHYGYQPPADVQYTARDGVRRCPGDKSLTHLEYAWARESGIPRLLFILRDTDAWGNRLPWPGWHDATSTPMADFKAAVRDDGATALFRSPANLARMVNDALEAELTKRGQEIEYQGWRVMVAPRPTANFVGRQRDVDAIRELLNNHQRVVIRGSGGIGKTALARYIGRALSPHYSGGVLWAELGPSAIIPDLVLPRIWAEWQHVSPPGRATPTPDVTARAMREWLLEAPGPLLAIIDDVTHAGILDAVLDSLPTQCHVLITTRDADLASSHPFKPYPLSTLEPESAVGLLQRRLSTPANHDPEQATAVAALLGNHPLALEMAGNWLAANESNGLQSLEARLTQNDNPFAALSVGPDGDSNLERVLAVVYRSLPEDARRDLRYLGTLPAGLDFSAETAFAVWGIDLKSPGAVAYAERRLGWLVWMTLLQPTGAGRFRFHASVYAYIRALYASQDGPILDSKPSPHDTQEIVNMIDGDTEAPLQGSLFQHDTATPSSPDTAPVTPPFLPMPESEDKTLPNRPNTVHQHWPDPQVLDVEEDPVPQTPDSPVARYHHEVVRLAMRFIDLDLTLWQPYLMLDMCHIAHEMDELVRQIEMWPRVGLLESWAEPEAHIQRSALPRHAGTAVLRAALTLLHQAQASRLVVHWRMGTQGRRWLSLGLVAARILDERKAESDYLRMLAAWNDEQERRRQAIAYYEAHLDICRQLGDARAESETLVDVGRVHRAMRDFPRALNYFHQALLINRRLRDQPAEANTLNKIGAIHYRLGENSKALDYFNQALYLTRAADDRDGEAATLHNMSFLVDSGEAISYMERAVELWSVLKSPNLKRAEQRLAELRWATEPAADDFDDILLLAAYRAGGEKTVRLMLQESEATEKQIQDIIKYLHETKS